MNATTLAHVGRGFASPVHDAQQVFRGVLDAMARPGSLQRLPIHTLQHMETPSIDPALCAVLLTLLDAETSLHIGASLGDAALGEYLRFHTGVQLSNEIGNVEFAALPAVDADVWDQLDHGSDETPQRGATLIVPVASLGDAGDILTLRGPGIEHEQRLTVKGLARGFWAPRQRAEHAFPRGVDLILTCGDIVAAVPRTTRITCTTLEG